VRSLTRRQALGTAALVAAPVALRAIPAAAGDSGDAAVLLPVVRLERFAQAAYRAVEQSASGEVRALARRFADHEDQHVAALATALEALGAPRPGPVEGTEALDAGAHAQGIAPVFSDVHDARGRLGFLLAVEERLQAAWIRVHRDISEAGLLQTAAQILACQAQHAVVLREALGRPPVP
jgi:hypothetical protein